MLTIVAGISTAILIVSLTQPAKSVAEASQQAKSADAFVDSIGVNTQMGEGRAGSPYTEDNYPLVKEKLVGLGVRHIRDSAYRKDGNAHYNNQIYGRYRELADHGVKTNLILFQDRYDFEMMSAQEKVAWISGMAGPALESLEGTNEHDFEHDPATDSDWAATVRNHQRSIYTATKNYGPTSDLPVIAPSLGRAANSDKVGDLSAYLDYGNMHSYPGGRYPSHNLYGVGLDDYYIPNARKVSKNKPLIATETGYHNALNCEGSGGDCLGVHAPISERAAGKYMPRLFLEYFRRGIARTYSYHFIDVFPDPEREIALRQFGLLRNDGTERPAYKSLKNLIGLLEDPGPDFAPDHLNYSLSGDTANVHSTLLQKRDGKFYLVLWQEAPSYNTSTDLDTPVPAKSVTLNLGATASEATTYLPSDSANPVGQYSDTSRMSLNVPDHPLVVELASSGQPASSTQPDAVEADTIKPLARPLSPRPGSVRVHRKALVQAAVRDPGSKLSRSDITFFLNGRKSNAFTYNPNNFRLRYKTPVLPFRRHVVTIRVSDASGNVALRRWGFVVRRR